MEPAASLLPLIGVIPFPEIDPVLIEIGPVAIRWYALAYVGGLFFAWWYVARLAEHKDAPLSRQHADDFLLWATAGVIIGERLGYVVFYNLSFYLDNPIAIFRLWDGGMSFHGGLIGVCLAVIVFARRNKLPLFEFSDLIGCAAPVGLFLGRIANFINGELWGRASDVPWAMVFPGAGPEPRHPSQLYEAMFEGFILFWVLFYLVHYTQARRYPGLLAGVFMIGYGVSRFLVEYVREPDSHLGLLGGFISMGQLLSLPVILFGIYLINHGIRAHRKAATETKGKASGRGHQAGRARP